MGRRFAIQKLLMKPTSIPRTRRVPNLPMTWSSQLAHCRPTNWGTVTRERLIRLVRAVTLLMGRWFLTLSRRSRWPRRTLTRRLSVKPTMPLTVPFFVVGPFQLIFARSVLTLRSPARVGRKTRNNRVSQRVRLMTEGPGSTGDKPSMILNRTQ